MNSGKLIVIVGIIGIIVIVALVVAALTFAQGKIKFLEWPEEGSEPKSRQGKKDDEDNEDSDDNNDPFKKRLSGLGIAAASVLGLLVAKLWSMQLVSSEEYSKRAELNRTRTLYTPAPRGRILDRNGVPLVKNRACLAVTASDEVLKNPVELTLLSHLLGMPTAAVRRKLQDSTKGAQSLRLIAIDVPRMQVAYINEHQEVFKGVYAEERSERYYPYGDLAAHVLGYTGPITEDQLKQSQQSQDDASIRYVSGDVVGQSGVELEYESVLQGVRGEQTVYVNANGRITERGAQIPAQSGSDIMLTLDKDIQIAAEAGLNHALERAHKQGNTQAHSAACLVLDAHDGSVLAMASKPSFYPSSFVGGISPQDWEDLSSKESGYPLMNRAVSGQFIPASTIKPLSVFAALDYKMATPESTYVCHGYWTGMGKAYGKYCWDHSGHGALGLIGGITYSCDVVFYEIAKAFYYSEHKEGLQATFRKWGLGKKTGIDLPGEAKGRVPDAKWKWNHYTSSPDEDRKWQGGDTTNIVIGQGDMLVTPIQMAEVYLGIANRGPMWRPHVLKSILNRNATGSVIDYKPSIYLNPKEPKEDYSIVDQGLKGVIYKESPGITKHFENLDVEVAGKTGSGERAGDKAATGWFCAFAPASKPEYVVVALVENGGFGSTTALYAVRDVLGEIYHQPDTSTADTAAVQ